MNVSTFLPETADDPQLQQLSAELAAVPEETTLYLQTAVDSASLALSPLLTKLLRHSLHELQQGRGLTIIPTESELSTVEAAHLLGVSRPFLVANLLDAGVIPFHLVGTHRRIALRDLLAYQQEKQRQQAVLNELAALDQEMGLL